MSEGKAAEKVVMNCKDEPSKPSNQDEKEKKVTNAEGKEEKEPTKAKPDEMKSVQEPGIV